MPAAVPFAKVEGPALIYLVPYTCGTVPSAIPETTSLTPLGVSEAGVQISIQSSTHRVNSDDNGGQEGAPAEILFMASSAAIRFVLVKSVETELAKVRNGIYSTAAEGTVPLPGTPIFAGGYGYGVIIIGPHVAYFFPRCEAASSPREFNISSTETKTSIALNAYPVYAGTGNGSHVLYIKGAGAGAAFAPYNSCQMFGGSVGQAS